MSPPGRLTAGSLLLGSFAEADGSALCRDTYLEWISLYCWTTFHAAVMATPEQILFSLASSLLLLRIYSDLSNCTALMAEALACPWPSPALDSFFLQIHMENFPNCTVAASFQPSEPPLGPIVTLATVPIFLTLLLVALILHKARKAEPSL
uniref:Uncharacterized protein n=1 Tax=Pelusios castaneus TaxID=367368 RepID=A0A8C8VDR4_9SAUR